MLLNKPSFPISYSFEECIEFLEALIKKRGWQGFEVAEVKLVYRPYAFGRYTAYTESVAEETGQKIVSEAKTGSVALDASTAELSGEISDLLEQVAPIKVSKPTENYDFEVIKPAVYEKEAKEVMPIELAERFKLPKENVLVSRVQILYVPNWVISLTVEGKNYRAEINAVTGKPSKAIEVPEREKGWIEVTQETIDELKEPGAWAGYSKALAGGFWKTMKESDILRQFLFNRRLQIGLLIVILILVLLNFLGLFP